MDELYLPPIENKYRKPDDSEDYVSSYKNKVFELPKVETKISYPAARVPKTYTTRKGALLLYAEDYFIPGSSKPRKRKRKPRRQTAVTFNTLGDLRDSILSYKKNGVSNEFVVNYVALISSKVMILVIFNFRSPSLEVTIHF